MNALQVIHPYKFQGTWVFDDLDAGLVKEPFVCGADQILEQMVAGIHNAEDGVKLIFSGNPFPGSMFELQWVREELGGHWYLSPQFGMEGWLCPALFKYFDKAPQKLFIQVQIKRQIRVRPPA